MYKFLFRTRYGALGFVVFTLISVTSLVGTDGEGGLIQYGIDSFAGQQNAMGEEISRLDSSRNRPVRRIGAPQPTAVSEIGELSDGSDDGFGDNGYEEGEWGDDEDLIDDAAGFDPEPIVSTEFDPEQGEIVEMVVGGGRGPMVPGDDE